MPAAARVLAALVLGRETNLAGRAALSVARDVVLRAVPGQLREGVGGRHRDRAGERDAACAERVAA
jgi:hypothetical protein